MTMSFGTPGMKTSSHPTTAFPCMVTSFFTLWLVWARATGEFGIADEPRSAMGGHIKFGNDPDAAIARVDDEVANLFLCVVQAVGAEFVQLWEFFAFAAETLIFR